MSNEHITDEQIENALGVPNYHNGFGRAPDMWTFEQIKRAILALRPAAQPVVEPVAYAVMWGARPMRKHSVHFELPTAEQVAAEVTSNKTMIRPLVFGDTTPQPVAVPDRVPMTDELEQALEMLVEQCNQDAVFSGAQAVIHAEAVLERLYKSRTGITTPKADK